MQSQSIDNSSFYDAQWKEWGDMIKYSPAPRFRRTRIISWLSKLPVSSLLDVGCGNGEFLLQAHKALPEVQFTGADVATDLVSSNRSRMPMFSFETLDISRNILPARYDAVTCMEVVEHCPDYQEVIVRLAEMTRRWLFITVPCGPLFEIDRRVGHVKHFRTEEMREALSRAGMKTVKMQRWGFPFFNLYKHAINLSPERMCESFLSSRGYSRQQKILASATYLSFRWSLSYGGYQLFALATR